MEQSTSRQTNSRSASQEISRLLWFNTVFITPRHWFLS